MDAPEEARFPTLVALADLAERCNTDRRFSDWGQGFSGVVAFEVDGEEGWMELDGGRIVAVGAGTGHTTIRISGSREGWQPIFDGQQGGLHRAWRHQRLRFTGDQVTMMRHYKMFWRLGDLLIGGEV